MLNSLKQISVKTAPTTAAAAVNLLPTDTSPTLQFIRTKKGRTSGSSRLFYRPNAEKRLKMIGMQRFTKSLEGKIMFWRKLIRQEKIVDAGPYVDPDKVVVKDKYDRYHKAYPRQSKRIGPRVRT